MKYYTVYETVTGEIVAVYGLGDEELINQYLNPDHAYVEGSYEWDKQYRDVYNDCWLSKPPKPSDLHTWDRIEKVWTVENRLLEVNVRATRQFLLQKIDQVNPLWYNDLTKEQQTELKQYRRALLDITKQSSFPNVIWPDAPQWLQ